MSNFVSLLLENTVLSGTNEALILLPKGLLSINFQMNASACTYILH